MNDIRAALLEDKFISWLFGKDGALFKAAAQGDLELVKELISEGANVSVASGKGFTPLHRASQRGHTDVVKLLIASGASPKVEADDNSTPLSLAQENNHTEIAELLA